MSLTLVLNAAEGVLQILLGRDGVPLCTQAWNAPTRGTEILAPALADMWARLGCEARDVTRIACVRGPGSFTGVRLVLATAAALRRCTGALLAGLDYMQALSCAADNAARLRRGSGAKHDGGASLWVLTHARRNCVHCQTFVSSGAEAPPHVSAPLELISPDEAVRRINAAPAPVVVGSGLARRRALFEEHCPAALLLPDAASTPSPEALWLLAQNAVYAAADIEPLYVRPCDAVENLSDIAARRGEAPEAAHAALARLLRRTPAPGEPA
ncbi:MAG: tRNA (adenosine(37)-N6)-threonylcarbamoyltransferase complex dimerization subunit type 1 TsaB [Desulfovibrionaceae bacterium]|nr:tRNA (adenosine(37)-N6)-threonylcarbamoyltransferase complex dimerization subunit type 1 TsaB [Desulfovibrionaceae bacterium]